MMTKEYLEREARYIDANAIKYEEHTMCYGHGMNLTEKTVTKEEVDKIPTADVVEVKHGEWIVENNVSDWRDRSKYILLIKCSECGTTNFLGSTEYENEYNEEKLKTLGNYADYSYCGHCGAKMDRKDK